MCLQIKSEVDPPEPRPQTLSQIKLGTPELRHIQPTRSIVSRNLWLQNFSLKILYGPKKNLLHMAYKLSQRKLA